MNSMARMGLAFSLALLVTGCTDPDGTGTNASDPSSSDWADTSPMIGAKVESGQAGPPPPGPPAQGAPPPQLSPSSSAAVPTSQITPELRTFLLANQKLTSIMQEMGMLLKGVSDNAETAAAAAEQLSVLNPQLKDTATKATAALMELTQSPESNKQLQRMMIQTSQEDVEFARQVRQELGLDESPQSGVDFFGLLVECAHNPQSAPLNRHIRAIRDTILGSRAPLAPVLVRRKLQESLGAVGAPLKTH